jgi:cell division protease FtsH
MARAMVTRYGMSEKLGPMVFGQKEELVFLGKELGEQRDYSDAVALEIDNEVRRIIHEAYTRTKNLLLQYRDRLDAVAQRLLEVETIDAVEFERFFSTPSSPQEAQPSLAPVPAR